MSSGRALLIGPGRNDGGHLYLTLSRCWHTDAMNRALVAVEATVGVSAEEFVAAWTEVVDDDTSAPPPQVEAATGATFLPGLTELVVIPLAVNMASAVLYDLIRRALRQAGKRHEVTEVELAEITTAQGDRVVVARARREVS
jgi:hypothetical protein